jgi:hypothetical protein
MKNLILSLMGMLLINLTFAQGNGGQFPENSNLKLSYLGGGKVLVTNKQAVTGSFLVQDNKHDSTLIIVAGGTGIFYLDPSLKSNINIKGKALTNCGGDCGWVELFISTLPITLTSWTAKVDAYDSTLVHLAWSVSMEGNVAYYRIDGSTDYGRTWDTSIARINSLGDVNLNRDYKIDYYNPLVGLLIKTAGFGIFGMFLIIAIFAGSIRNRALAGTVACLLLVTTFACKKSIERPKQGLKYNAVKLNEVDKDGSVKDFATRQLKY